MIRTMSPKEWFEKHVNIEKLTQDVVNGIAESIRFNNLDNEGENYIAHIYDIVSGGNGLYVPYYALEFFGYELNTDDISQYDLDSTLYELESFTDELSEIINCNLGLNIDVRFDFWESDGSYVMLALLNRDEYNSKKENDYKEINSLV